jgi:Iap family predicted aminopeptidase
VGVAGGDTRADKRIRQARLADVEAAIDTSFALEVVGDLAAIGASDLGFRVSGTPEDDAACALVAERMAAVGLQVELEAVPVDAWRFRGASLTVGSEVLQCSSFGGVPGTPQGGLEGDLVYVGEGTRGELAGLDLVGRIALFDWRGDQLFWPSATAAELGRAGALAVVCTCLHGGRYYQGERALGSFDAMWLAGSPPLAYLVREDAEQLIARLHARETLRARVVIDAQLIRGATGHNVVGMLPGRSQEAPIVIGAHHDCWFAAAFDDATGVAATLAIAKALADTGYEPEQSIVFTSHTAEEYGRADAAFDWLIGAWWQIEREHPEWAGDAALYVNIEGTGMACPTAVDSPPELRRFARRVLARARRDGLLRHGNVWGVPRTGTEQWPFAAAGVPSLGLADQVEEYMRIAYHTQHDRIELVDPACFTDAVRLYARFVIAADRNPGALLDLAARPRDIRRHGRMPALAHGGVDTRHLQASLDRYESAAGRRVPYEAARRAFSMTASAVEGLNARDKQDLSHRQAATDVVELTAAVRSLACGRRRSAISALERVGRNALTARLSEPVFAHDAARHQPDHPGITWAGPHLTPSPNLWTELASLRGEEGARAPGAWIGESLEAARLHALHDAQTRLEAVAASFDCAADLLEASAT